MNYAHIHILLNHFPTIGTVFGLALFVTSLVRKNDELQRASLVVLALMALLGLPTFLSGSAAQGIVRNDAGISRAAIEAHQNAAILTTLFLALTGSLAWFALWQSKRFSRPPTWALTLILLLTVVTVGLMLRTGTLGGEINHPEIRTEDVNPDQIVSWRGVVQDFVNTHFWAFPSAETLHFVGLSLLFGVVIVVNLRVMGFLPGVSFPTLHRLLPMGMFGFLLLLVTGMVFFLTNAERYIAVPTFAMKIALIVLSGINLMYFTVFDQPWKIGANDNAPLTAKVVAVSAFAFLFVALYFGRMIPFFEGY